jgi:hypothetical protein
MNEEELIPFLCLGGLVFMFIILFALLLLGSGPITFRKRTEGANTCLTVTARRNIARLCLVTKDNDEEVTFERRRLKKNQSIDFVYPASKSPGRLTVEIEPGNVKVFDI